MSTPFARHLSVEADRSLITGYDFSSVYELTLPFRSPFDSTSLLGFFEARAIPGVETADTNGYSRAVRLAGSTGSISVKRHPEESSLLARVSLPSSTRSEVARRLTTMFDLDADVDAIGRVLGKSARLKPLLRRHAGIRVPGAWDPFEIVVRAIVGQQVSVAAARTILGRIVKRASGEDALVFPDPTRLAETDLHGLGMPDKRADCVRAVAAEVAEGSIDLRGDAESRSRLLQLRGIGPWTVAYIAMRAFHDADAFPHGDLVLRRAAGDSAALSAKELLSIAEAWRPHRAYAAILLWAG